MKPSLVRKPVWLAALLILVLAQSACNFATRLVGGVPSLQASSTEPASCANKYLAARAGAVRTLGGGGYTEEITLANLGTSSFEEHYLMGADNSQKSAYTYLWNCTKAGLVLIGVPEAKVLSTTGVTVPASINPGDQWTQFRQTASGTITDNYTAIGEETVVVTGGTFTALKIQVNSTIQMTTSGKTSNLKVDGFEWLAPGIGTVKTSYTFTYPTTTNQQNRELQSYSNP